MSGICLAAPNFELIRHDITLPIWLEVDEIYNLACPAAPGHYQYNPIKTMKTSVLGAIHVLGMAKRCRAKVLQASTSEVYGDPQVHPQPESYRGSVNPIGPRACYDEGKRAAETLFMDYHRANGVNVRIVRIFNTYGPRMHPYDGRVISNFIRQALEGEDITIFGDGRQTRSFCYRDDLVEGLIRMMNAPDDFCGPVNLGNPEEFTIRELAEIVIELTGSRLEARSRVLCRPTIPPSGGPTLRSPSSGWAGSRRFPCARGWPRRSTGSARSTCPSTARRRRIIDPFRVRQFIAALVCRGTAFLGRFSRVTGIRYNRECQSLEEYDIWNLSFAILRTLSLKNVTFSRH